MSKKSRLAFGRVMMVCLPTLRAQMQPLLTNLAEQMVSKLQAEILAGSGGVRSTSIDGMTINVSRRDLLKELTHWQKVVARENGTRPTALTIDLSNAATDVD